MRKAQNYLVSPTTPGMRRIVAALEQHGALDQREIAKVAHLSVHALHRNYLPAGRQLQLIYVAEYERQAHGAPIPRYAAGNQKDAKPLPRLTQAEYCRRWRARSGASQFEAANNRLRRPDPVLAALLGMGA